MRCWLTRSIVVVMCSLLSAIAVHAEQPTISWRVENPFRLFTDPADTKRHQVTYEALSESELQSPILSSERQLARRHEDGWAAALRGDVCWDRTRNRYRCGKAGGSYVKPREHRIEAELADLGDDEWSTCTWLTAPLGRNRRRGVSVTQPCNQLVELDIPYPNGANVSVEVSGKTIARSKIQVRDLLIVGMGDSFGSGEGNPDIPVRFSRERTADYGSPSKEIRLAGYPARVGSWSKIGDKGFIANNAQWLDQACHRSLYSHQLRVALQLAIEDPHRAVTFIGFACSGAEVTKGLFLRYKGNEWVPNPPEVSQISAVAQAQCGGRSAALKQYPEAYHMRGLIPDLKGGLQLYKCDRRHARKIDLILVSIGGNDIGFARLVANAVLRNKSVLKRLGGWFGQVHTKLDVAAPMQNLDARYKALHRAFHNVLHVPWSQNDRIILTAYPPLALLGDGRTPCPDGRIGMDVLPAFSLDSKRARDGEDVSERLYQIMRAHAKKRRWTFASAHREAFFGHGICAGYQDLAVRSANELRMPRKLNGYWDPYNPADYRAYVPRKRWFRTPNDAFLTGNFHVTGSLLRSVLQSQSLRWTQLLLASTYSGAFHPTAEGHAAIADAVVGHARAVLRRYGVPDVRERARPENASAEPAAQVVSPPRDRVPGSKLYKRLLGRDW